VLSFTPEHKFHFFCSMRVWQYMLPYRSSITMPHSSCRGERNCSVAVVLNVSWFIVKRFKDLLKKDVSKSETGFLYTTMAVVSKRGVASPQHPWQGAPDNLQGCPELIRFSIYHLKVHFQSVIRPQSKFLCVRHWVPQLCFYFVKCRKPKMVSKRSST